MKQRKTFRDLLAIDGPLILPGAHDGLSARLIEQAGFNGYFIGGFPVVGARYGVPDIGLKGLGEIAAGVRDIVAASSLPVLVDGDDGYGDVKNVVHTVHTYERLGVAAIMLEDQRWPKRCGHMAGKAVVAPELMEAKIRAATQEKMNADTFIIARTDARAVNGLDDAMQRAERYVRAGADGIFIEAPRDVAELTRIGRAFDIPQACNPLLGGLTPILTPAEYLELGFKIIPYGINLLMHVTFAMQQALLDMKAGRVSGVGSVSFKDYVESVGFDDWVGVEQRHGQPAGGSGGH